MSTRRTAKIAEAIRQVVSSAILFELRDPRVEQVTVLSAEVPADLKTAKVFISVLGDEKKTRLCLQGLNSARGWLQSKIADELQLRYTPVISFEIDQGIKNSAAVAQILAQLKAERGEDGSDAPGEEGPPAQADEQLMEDHSGWPADPEEGDPVHDA